MGGYPAKISGTNAVIHRLYQRRGTLPPSLSLQAVDPLGSSSAAWLSPKRRVRAVRRGRFGWPLTAASSILSRSDRGVRMYLVRLFDGRNLIGTINWSRHPLEGVITQAHNALVRGPATRIEIERRDGKVVYRVPAVVVELVN